MKECESFYQNLYSSKANGKENRDDFFLAQQNQKSLNNDEQLLCEGLLSRKEILTNALNYSYEKGKLSISQRRGIVKLIPKKDAELNLIKNWRPLTLLNCDYKMATKAIASRMKTLLPKLISNDQTGFIQKKNRFIRENIRSIDSIITYTAVKRIPGLLLFLNFEKVFDTLEWSFIHKTLRHFGFGSSFSNWMKVFLQKH